MNQGIDTVDDGTKIRQFGGIVAQMHKNHRNITLMTPDYKILGVATDETEEKGVVSMVLNPDVTLSEKDDPERVASMGNTLAFIIDSFHAPKVVVKNSHRNQETTRLIQAATQFAPTG